MPQPMVSRQIGSCTSWRRNPSMKAATTSMRAARIASLTASCAWWRRASLRVRAPGRSTASPSPAPPAQAMEMAASSGDAMNGKPGKDVVAQPLLSEHREERTEDQAIVEGQDEARHRHEDAERKDQHGNASIVGEEIGRKGGEPVALMPLIAVDRRAQIIGGCIRRAQIGQFRAARTCRTSSDRCCRACIRQERRERAPGSR